METMEAKKDLNFEHLEEDGRWIQDNFDALRKEFEGKVFAVRRKRVIASNDNVVLLVKKLEEKGEDLTQTLIESIPPRDVSFIL
ncbi:MAG: hypothetical protein ACE5IJ_03290 [Thermoplasmata archaeon]